MEQPISAEPRRAAISDRRRIEELLGLYPDISPDEAREITTFLREAPIFERGLLGQTDLIREKLALFRKEHRADFAISKTEWLVLTGLAALTALAIFLLWNIGR